MRDIFPESPRFPRTRAEAELLLPEWQEALVDARCAYEYRRQRAREAYDRVQRLRGQMEVIQAMVDGCFEEVEGENARALEHLRSHSQPEGDCVVWTGTRMPNGYGQIYFHGRTELAHRAAFRLAVGPIPVGFEICHRCDNRPCVKIDHLFVGTRSDNMRDAQNKGRTRSTFQPGHESPRGEDAYGAKLTEEQAREVRQLALKGDLTQFEIADRFGIDQSTVSNIKSGKIWGHLVDEAEQRRYAQGSRGPWPVNGYTPVQTEEGDLAPCPDCNVAVAPGEPYAPFCCLEHQEALAS